MKGLALGGGGWMKREFKGDVFGLLGGTTDVKTFEMHVRFVLAKVSTLGEVLITVFVQDGH